MKKHILIVDDDSNIQDLLSRYLDAAGYEVILASDGKDALRKCVLKKPDLILMDFRMPELDGLNALDLMTLTQLGKRTPIIMMSGTATAEVMDSARRLGATDFLVKPFNPAELVDKLEAYIAEGPRPLVEPARPGASPAPSPIRPITARAAQAAPTAPPIRPSAEPVVAAPEPPVETLPEIPAEPAPAPELAIVAPPPAVELTGVTEATAFEPEPAPAVAVPIESPVPLPAAAPVTVAPPPSLDPALPPAIDERFLSTRVVAHNGRNREAILRAIEEFVGQSQKVLLDTQLALREQKAEEAARLAQALKDGGLRLGAYPFASLCADLEALLESGTVEGGMQLVRQLRDEYKRCKQQLEAFRENLA